MNFTKFCLKTAEFGLILPFFALNRAFLRRFSRNSMILTCIFQNSVILSYLVFSLKNGIFVIKILSQLIGPHHLALRASGPHLGPSGPGALAFSSSINFNIGGNNNGHIIASNNNVAINDSIIDATIYRSNNAANIGSIRNATICSTHNGATICTIISVKNNGHIIVANNFSSNYAATICSTNSAASCSTTGATIDSTISATFTGTKSSATSVSTLVPTLVLPQVVWPQVAHDLWHQVPPTTWW